ncbi:TetR/AcrR family transcriptional regulator [Myceligenerans crystallogenes]|uniref:TetR/AcrR family transcriptional regulator n=1 Tax=Myceligenerans crystallogenes TaxID=316335 RepID=A0ABN2NKA2_9MICO
MRPKQQRGEATAERVLDTALRLYAAGGEAGVTVAALTRETGISTGSIYHHFGSLNGVLGALTHRSLAALFDEIGAALRETTDARAGIDAFVGTYLGFMAADPVVGRLLHSTTVDEMGWKHAREMRDAQEARLTPIMVWIGDRQREGELAQMSGALVESLILGPVIGCTRRWIAVGDIDLAEAMKVLPERIWRSVQP